MFFVNFSEVEDRLDPQYFFSKNNLHLANNTIFPVYPIAQVLDLQRGKFGHRPRNDPKLYNGQYPFIQTGDIVKASLNNLPIEFSQTLNELGLKTSRLVSEKVVVLTIAANIGYTAILDYSACFPDSLIAIKPKEEQTLYLEYIDIYFKSIRQYLDDLAPQAAQKNINYQQLAKIPFVVPPQKRQQEIIELKHKNNILANQKLKQSQTLLNSISDYLLEKLGITVPKVDNSLNSRIFFVNANDICGGRLDPFNQIGYYREFAETLLQNKFGYKPLKDFIIHDCSGNWGNDIVDNFDENIFDKCLIVRATEFDNQDNLQLNADKIKFRLLDKQKLSNLRIQENDILVEKSGGSENQPVGRVAILDTHILEKYDGNIAFSNFIHKISVDKNMIDPHFLFYYLKMLHHFKYTERMQSQTNGIRNLILKDFFDIPILNVPLETQKNIVTHIKQIREQAQNLEQQAKDLLQQTQQEIEKMILGN